jgi:hypothetical protein
MEMTIDEANEVEVMTREEFIKLLWDFESRAFAGDPTNEYRLKLLEVFEKQADIVPSIGPAVSNELRAARAVVECARAGRELGNGGMTEDEYDRLERALDTYDKVK